MQQYPENASPRNSPKTIGEKGVRWDLHLQKIKDANSTIVTDGLILPKSGVRRNSVHLNAFNESHNAIHDGVAKSRFRNRWHKIKGFLGKQRARESPSMGNNDCNNWDCISDSYSSGEKTDEPIFLEDCFRRSDVVTAIPEEASSDSSITFVSRSFEVNPTAGNHWSTLKEAISSGKILEKLEDEDERSGLRRASFAPAIRMEAKAPNGSQSTHSGWFKIKRLFGGKLPSQSPKYGVTYSGNNSISGNEIDGCVCKDAPDVLQSNRDEEFYAVIDSSVQALPSAVVSNTEVVSVTRSFEYHGNWQKIRSMIKEQDRNQEQKFFASSEKNHSSSSEVKTDCLENALLKKDVYCQTEFDLEKAFQHQILKNLICGFCGSKYEERVATITKGKIDHNKTSLGDDEGGCKSFPQQIEKSSVWEKKIESEKDSSKQCGKISGGAKLVEDILESKELTTTFQEDGDIEVTETLRKYHVERKGNLPDSKKKDLDFCEGSSSAAFDDDSISFDNKIIKHEREECRANKGLIAGYVDEVVGKAFDDDGFDHKKNYKDHQNDTKLPECETTGTVIEDHKAIVLRQKVEEATDVIHASKNRVGKDVVSGIELPVSALTVRTEHTSKEGQSPRIPVTITAKVLEYEKPFVISYV